MKKFEGKIFLELGTSVGSVDIVKYAKSEGAYVIVADYLPTEKSEAKQYADEVALISTLDVEAIYEFAKEKKIDGIFCGVSEANLLTVYEVCKRLGLPCYFNTEQFRLNHDKLYFKQKCSEYGILTPKLFEIYDENDPKIDTLTFPVVVKPNDMGAGIGVAICRDVNELKEKLALAKKLSLSGSAFVEEYIVGDEVSIVYTIKDGKASLSHMKDRLISKDHSNIASLMDVALSPSNYLNEYIENQNNNVLRLLENELYRNGTAFLQGICKNGKIYFLEMGCRMSGGADYKLIEQENGISFMKMLVDISLMGNCNDFDISADNPYFAHVTGRFNLFAHAGEIGMIKGLEDVVNMPEIISYECRRALGDVIVEDGSLRQEVLNFHIFTNNRQELASVIEKIQKSIVVLDTDGNNMLFSPFDTNRLF